MARQPPTSCICDSCMLRARRSFASMDERRFKRCANSVPLANVSIRLAAQATLLGLRRANSVSLANVSVRSLRRPCSTSSGKPCAARQLFTTDSASRRAAGEAAASTSVAPAAFTRPRECSGAAQSSNCTTCNAPRLRHHELPMPPKAHPSDERSARMRPRRQSSRAPNATIVFLLLGWFKDQVV